MTFRKVWIVLRWPLAILGLLAVASYAWPRLKEAVPEMIDFDASGSILAPESEGSESETEGLPVPAAVQTLEPNTGPVADGTNQPVADFFVNDTVADIDNDALIITPDVADSIIVAFDIPQGDPNCMASMTLDLTVTEVQSPAEIGIFAANLEDAAEVVDNQQVEGDLRQSQAPMASQLIQEPGRVSFDIRVGYQGYFDLGLPPRTPFVLALVPTVPIGPEGGIRFAASNTVNPEDAPTLTWTGLPDCTTPGDPGTGISPTPTATPTQ